ncbi:MAG: response regulator [Deltaproteobacteria bacterium]|nr:response regulator [Deltaproteobacteria bacterium]
MPKRILVIDDDIASVSAARRILKEGGYEPVVASNAADAEVVIEHDDPALVILSLSTDEHSGLEICKTIRQQAKDPMLPVLMIGDGQGEVTDAASALANGGDGFFRRPVPWAEVAAKVDAYLGMDRDREQTAVTAVPDLPDLPGPSDEEASEFLAAISGLPAAPPPVPAMDDGATDPGASVSFMASPLDEDEHEPLTDPGAQALTATGAEEAFAAAGGGAPAPEEEERGFTGAWEVTEPGRSGELADELFGDIGSEMMGDAEAGSDDDAVTAASAGEVADALERQRTADLERAAREIAAGAEAASPEEEEALVKERAEAEAKRRAEAMKQRAAAEAKKKVAAARKRREEEDARARALEEEARKAAEEAAQKAAEEEAARLAAEEAERQAAEEEAARLAAEEAAERQAAEEEAARLAAEEAAAQRAAEEEAARLAAEEAERQAAEEEAARLAAEEAAAQKAAEEAERQAAEEAARLAAEEAERQAAEEAARREAEAEAARLAAEEAARLAAEEARREAEELRRKAEAEEAARKAAKRAAKEKAREEARRLAEAEAERAAQAEAERRAQQEAERDEDLEDLESMLEDEALPDEPGAGPIEVAATPPEPEPPAPAPAPAPAPRPARSAVVEGGWTSFEREVAPTRASGWGAGGPTTYELESLQGEPVERSSRLAIDLDAPDPEPEPPIPAPPAEVEEGSMLLDPFGGGPEIEASAAAGWGAAETATEEGVVEGAEGLDPEALAAPTWGGYEPPTPAPPPPPPPAPIIAVPPPPPAPIIAEQPPPPPPPPAPSYGGLAAPAMAPAPVAPAPVQQAAPPPPPPVEPPPMPQPLPPRNPAPPPAPAPHSPAPQDIQPNPTGAPFPEEGDLLERDLPRLLADLYRARATGVLEIHGAAVNRAVFVELGRVVGASSTSAAERLEEVACRLGRITRQQARQIRAEGDLLPRQAAVALVEAGQLKAQELYDTVRAQAQAALFGAFSEEEGRWRWIQAVCPEDARVALPDHPFALVAEGIRRKYTLDRIHRCLGGPATVLAPTETAGDWQVFGFSARERRVATSVDGLHSAEELVFLSGLGEEPTYQVLYVLESTGQVSVRVRGAMPEGRASTPEEAQSQAVIDRTRIEEKFRQALDADYFEILGVTRDATAYEIKEAYERLSREMQPARYADVIYQDLWGKLEEIRRGLDDAYDVLRDEGLRADYLSALV